MDKRTHQRSGLLPQAQEKHAPHGAGFKDDESQRQRHLAS
jgi:hypothetical protein